MNTFSKLLSKTWFRISLGLITLTASIFSLVLVWLFTQYNQSVIASTPPLPNIESTPVPTPDPNAPVTILVAGYGGAGHEGGNLTDTMIVAYINPISQQISLISVPRDLWYPFELEPGKFTNFKINHAFAIGSDDEKYPNKPDQYKGETGGYFMIKQAIETVTGLPINHFVAINFDQFTQAIDALGGIDAHIQTGFTDKYYPIKGKETDSCGRSEEDIANLTATMSGYLLEQQFPCRYEELIFQTGTTHMDGTTALKFVRSRHSDTAGNDFNRSVRQQAVISALKSQLLKLESLPKLIPFFTKLSQGIITTIDIPTSIQIANHYNNFKDFTFQSIQLTTENVLRESRSQDRQYILVPKSGNQNWDSIHKYLESQLDSHSTPSAQPN